MRAKISVIGAGNVGREVAAWCAIKELGDIVIWNRTKERAIGIALDLMEAAPLVRFDVNIMGTGNLYQTRESDVIVFTAGLPRTPGVKREDLVKDNAKIVIPLVKEIAKYSPKAIIIVVTNPLDVMAYVALKVSNFSKKRIIGMAGILDSSRFESFIAEDLKVSVDEVIAPVLGSHGENMIPISRLATVAGIPLEELMTKKRIEQIAAHTKEAGQEIVLLLQENASFSVGAAAAKLVECIIKDEKKILNCSAYLEGEYGLRNVFIGVPCKIGRNGIEKIIKLKLNSNESSELHVAANRIKGMIKEIDLG